MNYRIYLFSFVLVLYSCSDKWDDFFGGTDGNVVTTCKGIVINGFSKQPIPNHKVELFYENISFLSPGGGPVPFITTKTDLDGRFEIVFTTMAHKSYSVAAISDTAYTCVFANTVKEGGTNNSTIEIYDNSVVKVVIWNKTHYYNNIFPEDLYLEKIQPYTPNQINTLGHNNVRLTYDENKRIPFFQSFLNNDSFVTFAYIPKLTPYRAILNITLKQKDTTITKQLSTSQSDTTFLNFGF